jgi:chromosome segregation ATPase
MIPNRETIGIDMGPQREYPDLMEFERLLRRHFPHVNVFGAQPLYGAVLTPLGRRSGAEPPVFDDRLLPDGGEPPTHFLALCSHRYQRFDDTTIAQVPFIELAEGVRARAEKLEGTLTVLRLENDARGREIESQGRRLRELEEELARTQFERRDRASLTAELSRLEEAVRRRDALLAEAQEALDSERRGGGARSEELLDAKLRLRQVEQKLADVELASEHAARERDEAETARARLQSVLADSAAERKARQRELDDRMEVIAGLEVEVGALRSETSRLKQELVSTRDAARRASTDRSEIEESNARTESTAAQLARALSDAAVERERSEKRVEEIRLELRSEAAARAELERERVSLTQRLEELTSLRDRELSSARQATSNARAAQERGEQEAGRLQAEIERATALTEELEARLAAAARERSLTNARLERQDQALVDLRRIVAELSDEAGRRALLIETLTSRAGVAETNAATLQENGRELHGALTAAEAEIADLRARVAQSEAVADDRDKALRDMASLRAEVARTRPEANAAASARQRAAITEALLLERENASRALDLELTRTRERAETAEAQALEHKNASHALDLKLRETRERTESQDRDLAAALEALAVSEETVDARMQTAAERIRAMRADIKRLTDENETELLKVREDLETELRTASAQLERREGEIWELKEETLRLRAQVAATVASQVSEGPMAEFQESLADQENQIFTLGEDRDRLRVENERLARSVNRAKKNVRILVTLLRKERILRREIAADDAGISPTLSDSDLEMIAEIADPENDTDDMLSAIDARLSSRPAPVAPYRETAEEVDSVMDGLRVASPHEGEEPTEKTELPGGRTRDPS